MSDRVTIQAKMEGLATEIAAAAFSEVIAELSNEPLKLKSKFGELSAGNNWIIGLKKEILNVVDSKVTRAIRQQKYEEGG